MDFGDRPDQNLKDQNVVVSVHLMAPQRWQISFSTENISSAQLHSGVVGDKV